ncbi:lignin degradation protein [Histoplasma capsulatum var. duboisii H88]|uniref:Lignin degradation protein n=1 Tax=Ajellomyces capsulatus (strain H88) TaxID=544711 RepID=F0UBF3_AJEC8|nr:lignin degradation protein [Histoplasma capsulatum var. duboisii H88]QSS50011.1 lignin degradation protein [Histoplasma capsulatum var. duboisii H88]
MANDSPVHFFDIASKLPIPFKSWSPNTLRTRLVLNYKKIPYTQSFISYPDIAPLLQSLSVPPLPGSTNYLPYPLPAITHPATLAHPTANPHGVMNDSWPIALHLEGAFPAPDHPTLFPSAGSHALALAVMKLVSALVPATRRILVPQIPALLDERGAAYFRRTREEMFGVTLEAMAGDKRGVGQAWESVEADVELVRQMLRGRGGPFFEGAEAGYADFVFVAFLTWYERGDRVAWERVVGGGDGEIKRLWEACLLWIEGQGVDREYVVGM